MWCVHGGVRVCACVRNPRYRKLRASMFVGLACMGVIPMLHMVFHNGLENKVRVTGWLHAPVS